MAGVLLAQIFGKLGLCAGRPDDQDLAGVADRVRDLREKLLVRRSVAAADRVGLVVEVLRLQVGMQRHLVSPVRPM